jgi:hypothetical protein
MKTNNIIIHATQISNKAEFTLNHNTFYPSVYRGEYHATLQGNILTVQHKQYDFITRSFALSYDMSRELSQLFCNTYYQTEAYKIMQRIVQLKAIQIVKEINKGV